MVGFCARRVEGAARNCILSALSAQIRCLALSAGPMGGGDDGRLCDGGVDASGFSAAAKSFADVGRVRYFSFRGAYVQ